MSLFVIGDLHLSFNSDKSMNIFKGWQDYEKRLEKNWENIVKTDDTVVLAGDVSWAMSLSEAIEDFKFIDKLPGTKIILKGNHDYWWNTKKKMDVFFEDNNLKTIKILHNNSYRVGDISICGTRGWFFDNESEDDKKVIMREKQRLQKSIECGKQLGGEPVVFLHYPPINLQQKCDEIYSVLLTEKIKRCYYGHLHGQSHQTAVNTTIDDIKFSLISGDFLEFCPKLVQKD